MNRRQREELGRALNTLLGPTNPVPLQIILDHIETILGVEDEKHAPQEMREAHVDEVLALDVRMSEQTLGSCLLSPYRDGFFLYRLWVKPEFRRQGIAWQLVAMAKTHSAGRPLYIKPEAFLDKPMLDDQIEAWYRRIGFVYTDTGEAMVCRCSAPITEGRYP